MKGKLKKNITDEEMFQENLEKDKARFLELHKLREYDVKDGYVLQLNKKIDGFTEGYAEIDVYVFNNIDGADEFFEYIKKTEGTSIPGLGWRRSRYLLNGDNAYLAGQNLKCMYQSNWGWKRNWKVNRREDHG